MFNLHFLIFKQQISAKQIKYNVILMLTLMDFTNLKMIAPIIFLISVIIFKSVKSQLIGEIRILNSALIKSSQAPAGKSNCN